MRKHRLSIISGTAIIALLVCGRAWAAVTDSADKLIVPAGETYTLSGAHAYTQSIEIYGTLYVKAYNATAGSGYLELSASTVTVAAGGKIDASGRGYRGGVGVYTRGEGPGGGAGGDTDYGGGGAYGGNSGSNAYGSITSPVDMGSGGGGANGGAVGGAGGGSIKINSSILINNGSILSDGANGGSSYPGYGGGGAGGSVLLTANTISGSGVITANGGKGASSAGGGAGGRVSFYYSTNSFTGTIKAYGNKEYGTCGGAGTIYSKSYSQATGDMIVAQNLQNAGTTPLRGNYGSVTIQNYGIVVSTAYLSSDMLVVKDSAQFINTGELVVNNVTVERNAWFDQRGTASIGTLEGLGNLVMGGQSSAKNFRISGTVVASTMTPAIWIEAENNLEITPSGVLYASGFGFPGGYGVTESDNYNSKPGQGRQGLNGGGGGYGGRGGDGASLPGTDIGVGGTSIGSIKISKPEELTPAGGGGGGNGGARGGRGGGYIIIIASNILVNNGVIAADGGNATVASGGQYCGGGVAGGGILVKAKNFMGNGMVSARGGVGGDPQSLQCGGGGGGGRISILSENDSYTGTITASGGRSTTQCGGPGTIFRRSTNQEQGELTVRNEPNSSSYNYFGHKTTLISGFYDRVIIEKQSKVDLNQDVSANIIVVRDTCIVSCPASVTVSDLTVSNSTFYAQIGQLTVNNLCSLTAAGLYADCPMVANNLEIQSGGALTHSKSNAGFDVKILNNLNIFPGGKIGTDGCGYPGGTYKDVVGNGGGPGGGGAGWSFGGGGGYGGNGATGAERPGIPGGTGGEMYGNSLEPSEMGSGGGRGGGNDTQGGDGGGKIKLVVSGMLTNNGIISANGLNGGAGYSSGYSGGGGAGGSINILASMLSGSGIISANGGNAGNSSAGAGAGGRIAVSCNNYTFSGSIEAKAGAGGATPAGIGSIITPSLNPDSSMNQSDAAINFVQCSLLNETISIQSISFSLNVTGDIAGNLTLSDTRMTTIKTGAFKNKGYLKAAWNGQLEGVNYSGSLKAVTCLDASQRKIFVKGAIEGNIKGAVEGYLVESLPQSNTYDQFVATWTFKYPLPSGQYSSGRSALQGTCTYLQYQEYPGVNLKYIQTSSLGNVSGSYTGSINTILNGVVVNDPAFPNNGEGFCVISYQSGADEGQGWFYSRTLINDEYEFSGMISNPLFGIVQGDLINRESEKKLWMIISRIDIAAVPKADLQLDVFSRNTASPGGTASYTIRVKNNGLVPASNIKVEMVLPLAARFLTASGDYQYENGAASDFVKYPDTSHGPESISWILPTIAAHSTCFMDVQTKTLWGLETNQKLNAEVGLFEYDPNYYEE